MTIGLHQVLGTLASSLSAESLRLNVTASNLANAGNVGASEASTYRAKHPVFSELTQNAPKYANQPIGGVQVSDIINGDKPLEWRLEPNNPLADENGRVYITDVNPMEEMMDMIAAAREYQSGVESMSSIKNLILQTIQAMDR